MIREFFIQKWIGFLRQKIASKKGFNSQKSLQYKYLEKNLKYMRLLPPLQKKPSTQGHKIYNWKHIACGDQISNMNFHQPNFYAKSM